MTDNTSVPVPPPYSSAGGQFPQSYGQGSPSSAPNPGKTLGIVGLILGIVGFVVAFVAPIAGIIVSIIGLSKSRRAGQKNGIALAGIIVSAVALIANIITAIVLISLGSVALDLVEQCQNDPTSVVEVQGEQIPCEELLRQSQLN